VDLGIGIGPGNCNQDVFGHNDLRLSLGGKSDCDLTTTNCFYGIMEWMIKAY
jgi:hypothetical protein